MRFSVVCADGWRCDPQTMLINCVFHLVEQFVVKASSLHKTFALSRSPSKKAVLEQIPDVCLVWIGFVGTVFGLTWWLVVKLGFIEVQFCGAERQRHDCEIQPERSRPGTRRHNARR